MTGERGACVEKRAHDGAACGGLWPGARCDVQRLHHGVRGRGGHEPRLRGADLFFADYQYCGGPCHAGAGCLCVGRLCARGFPRCATAVFVRGRVCSACVVCMLGGCHALGICRRCNGPACLARPWCRPLGVRADICGGLGGHDACVVRAVRVRTRRARCRARPCLRLPRAGRRVFRAFIFRWLGAVRGGVCRARAVGGRALAPGARAARGGGRGA